MGESTKQDSPWEMVTLSDPGMIRDHNEDVVEVHPDAGVVILADGMGGYNAGEVASALAVAQVGEAVLRHHDIYGFDDEAGLEDVLRSAVASAHRAILDQATAHPECAGMGTTLVMGVFSGGIATLAHVGDSRAYRWNGGQLSRVTRDHSLLQEQIDAGVISAEAARTSSNKNLVTRALGVENVVVEPEIRRYEIQPGDCFMFCSDGLSDMVDDDALAELFATTDSNGPEGLARLARVLVDCANDHGGRDNVSVALARTAQRAKTKRGLLQRIFRR